MKKWEREGMWNKAQAQDKREREEDLTQHT